MKYYLFSILLLFPFALAFGQTNGTVTNSSSNKISIEKKEVSNSEIIEIEEIAVPQIETESIEIASPPSPAKVQKRDKDFSASMSAQRAGYFSAYNTSTHNRNQRSFTESEKETMEQMLRNLSAAFPGSFESYFFYYLNGQNDLKRSNALLKANEMKPDDEMVQKEMMTYNVLMNKSDETRKAVLNLSQNGVYSNVTNSYGLDMINSAPANATLITHGKEDSYAALYAQKVKRVREDVEILSLDWLTSPQYRIQLKAAGWKLPSSEFIDNTYFEELCKLNKDKTIAVSMTLPKEYLLPVLDKLYVSGLVFEYRDIATDLTLRNEELWNNRLNKDVIQVKGNDLANNYLPMLYQLRKVYEVNGDSKAVKKLDAVINEIKTR